MATALNDETLYRLLKNIRLLIEQNYVSKEHLKALTRYLESKLPLKNLEPAQIASHLTREFYRITQDGHLSVSYDPEQAEKLKLFQNNLLQPDQQSPEPAASENEANLSIRQVTILTGGVGYIDIRDFLASPSASDSITSALQLVSGCTALILDLRQNFGGEVRMVQWLASYFFNGSPRLMHLYSDPRFDFQQQIWTYPFVPGVKHQHIPLYILVSPNTFSAAEEFAYDLQAMERAVVVGQQTGGGGHLTEHHAAGYHFIVNIPVATIINPITGGGWQGMGVTPDIICPSEAALSTAHLHALETQYAQEKEPSRKQRLAWDLETVKAQQQPLTVDQNGFADYVGQYADRQVVLRDGDLYVHLQHSVHKLIPLSPQNFYLQAQEHIRVTFLIEDQRVTGMRVTRRDDSRISTYTKTNNL